MLPVGGRAKSVRDIVRRCMIHFYKHWFILNCLIAWLISWIAPCASLPSLLLSIATRSCFFFDWIYLSLISLVSRTYPDEKKKQARKQASNNMKINTNWIPPWSGSTLELRSLSVFSGTQKPRRPHIGVQEERSIKHSHCLLKSRVRKINFTLLFMGSGSGGMGWRKTKKKKIFFSIFFVIFHPKKTPA